MEFESVKWYFDTDLDLYYPIKYHKKDNEYEVISLEFDGEFQIEVRFWENIENISHNIRIISKQEINLLNILFGIDI